MSQTKRNDEECQDLLGWNPLPTVADLDHLTSVPLRHRRLPIVGRSCRNWEHH